MKISSLVPIVKSFCSKNAPEIAMGTGLGAGVVSLYLAIKATPKAVKVLEAAKETAETPKDYRKIVAKTVIPMYIPMAITEVASIALILLGNRMNAKRYAALSAAYTLSETAFKEYKNKVIEKIGEKKELAVRDDICKDKIQANPITNNEVIITGAGKTLFYDTISGRYFEHDLEGVKKIQNELNAKLLSEMYISLNELYYELGLKCTEQGNQLGFNIDDGLIDFTFSAQMAEDGRPCIALGYLVGPRYGYGDRGYR